MTTLNISVIASSDDAEESHAPTTPVLTSVDLDFMRHDYDYVIIRFQDVTIPPGSTINSVIIRMTAAGTRTGTGHGNTIYCEDIDDAPTATTESGNISSRTKTSASVLWTPPAIEKESQYDTADFTAALQEVIDRPGWASGQDIAVIFIGTTQETGPRDFYAFDHGSDVPEIRIDYTAAVPVGGYALVF